MDANYVEVCPTSGVNVREGRVVVGPCGPEEIVFQALSAVDDDFRIIIGGVVRSDTRLNVTAYYGSTVSPGGAHNFNPLWATQGFRRVVLTGGDTGRAGNLVVVSGCDIGGSGRRCVVEVTVKWPGVPTPQVITIGSDADFIPPAWPTGTTGDPAELAKAVGARPFAFPGSPPIYFPIGAFTLARN
jgi:hypothetical protein